MEWQGGDGNARTIQAIWHRMGAAALAGLAGVGVVGTWLGISSTGRVPARVPVTEVATTIMAPNFFTQAEQQLMSLIPAGYAEGSCRPAADPAPFADAVAALDCFDNANPGGPTAARYQQFADRNAMDSHFQADAANVALQPCKAGTANGTGTPPRRPLRRSRVSART